MHLKETVISLGINRDKINTYEIVDELNRYRHSSNGDVLISSYIKNLGHKLFVTEHRQVILSLSYSEIQKSASNRNLVSGDKVCFLPGVEVPRYKFKEVGDEIGFVTKRSIENSNILVVGKKSIEKVFSYAWRNSPFEILYHRLEKILTLYGLEDQLVDLFPEELGPIEEDTKLILGREVYRILHMLPTPSTAGWSEFSMLMPERSDYVCLDDERDTSNDDIYNRVEYAILNNLEIMTSEFVNDFITGTVEADDKMYKRLDQMLCSNDRGNIELALETMTNLDYNNSLFTMLVLLNKHKDTIKYSKSYTSVSFKGFRQRLNDSLGTESYRIEDDYVFNYYINYVGYIQILGKLKILTKKNILALKNSIVTDMGRFMGTNYFQVDKVKYTDTLQNLLDISQQNIEELGDNFKDLNNYEFISQYALT